MDLKVKIVRVRLLSGGFSVLASCGGVERGFTFPLNSGWEDLVDGVPKYVSRIKELFLELGLVGSKDSVGLKDVEGREF